MDFSIFIQDVIKASERSSAGGDQFDVLNPSNGHLIAAIPDMTAEETVDVIEAAKKALPEWSGLTSKQRFSLMMKWHDLILEHQNDLAELLTLEMGKPIAEAKGEILYGASFIEWFAEEGKRLYGDIIPTNGDNRKLFVIKQPIGVVAAITPWNFPNAMITRKVAPALAAGCTVIIKPAEDTPLSAVALGMLAGKAGIPDGVFNIVTSNQAAVVAKVLTDSDDVRKLSFTGSTRVGKILMRQCADTVKKISLELGGNAPFIVFEDAKIDAAVASVMTAKFRNGGQTCVSLNRLYVQSSVMDIFAEKLLKEVEKLTVGDGFEEGCHIGPLINKAGTDKVAHLVSDARSKGAKILIGGEAHERGGNYYKPTILKDTTADMEITTSEIFGPVIVLYPFETEAEVIQMANDTPYGLASYFYTNDVGRIFRVAEALEYGMVAVNSNLAASESTPFGGVKQSGIGREGSKYGLDDFTEIKYMCLGDLSEA